nr:type IV secretory system conjugative DNA transfer family protein [Lachnospiraceae bacterium]
MTAKTRKTLINIIPCVLFGLFSTNIGEAMRLSSGKNASEKVLSFFTEGLGAALTDIMPSFHPFDLLIGALIGGGIRLFMYMKAKNAKKFRLGSEYGSARWGKPEDVEPFKDPEFKNNVILTATEMLTMESRPARPKYARNKNVLCVGGSGSGKTRYFIKPNLLQMHSSYVVTDPKGELIADTGRALCKNGYEIKVFNTINFKKSMHYNPFQYIHSEKDILKLVTALISNTKGEGTGNDPFWE